MDVSPFAASYATDSADLVVRTSAMQEKEQQQQQVKAPMARKVSFSKKLLSCACVLPSVNEDGCSSQSATSNERSSSLASSSNASTLTDVAHRRGMWDISPKRCTTLHKQGSAAFTDADW